MNWLHCMFQRNTETEPKETQLIHAEPQWRYAVVGNITKTHIDEQGILRYGSKAFRGGTKVYLCGRGWSTEQDVIGVAGLNRYKRFVYSDVSPEWIENVRCAKAYKPAVLKIMDDWEAQENWWNSTKEAKTETQTFVEEWNRHFNS